MAKPGNVSTAPPENLPSCTRCGKRDAEPGGNWCAECKEAAAEYQRNYRSADAIRARAEGMKLMREYIAKAFASRGSLMFSGTEIARAVMAAPNPPNE